MGCKGAWVASDGEHTGWHDQGSSNAHLLGVLQVVTVAFGHPAVDCHLDPHNLVNNSVRVFRRRVGGMVSPLPTLLEKACP